MSAADPIKERADNDRITERLLGWTRAPVKWGAGWEWMKPDGDRIWHEGPQYTNWAGAGLILDALAAKRIAYIWRYEPGQPDVQYLLEIFTERGRHCGAGTHGPLTVRAAALALLDYLEQFERSVMQ